MLDGESAQCRDRLEIAPFLKNCSRRLSIIQQAEEPLNNLFPNMRLTPLKVGGGVYSVLYSGASLKDTKIERMYMLVSHGYLSHKYSLLLDSGDLPSVVRPLANLETQNKHVTYAEVQDYLQVGRTDSLGSYKIVFFPDSYVNGHIEFCIDFDYKYVWRYVYSRFTQQREYKLFRFRISDGNMQTAARISPAMFLDPVRHKGIWSIELDDNLVPAHIAFLTAFAVKRTLPIPVIPLHKDLNLPKPLQNIAFEDDYHVYQRESKFFGDWDDEEFGRELAERPGPSSKVDIIKVFRREYLLQYCVPVEVLEYLSIEATNRATALKNLYVPLAM